MRFTQLHSYYPVHQHSNYTTTDSCDQSNKPFTIHPHIMSPTNSNAGAQSQSKSKSKSKHTTPTRFIHASRITKPSPNRLSRAASQLHIAKLRREALAFMEAEEASSSSSSSSPSEAESIILYYDENMDLVMHASIHDCDSEDEDEEGWMSMRAMGLMMMTTRMRNFRRRRRRSRG
jgi:hypothetical protein